MLYVIVNKSITLGKLTRHTTLYGKALNNHKLCQGPGKHTRVTPISKIKKQVAKLRLIRYVGDRTQHNDNIL